MTKLSKCKLFCKDRFQDVLFEEENAQKYMISLCKLIISWKMLMKTKKIYIYFL